MKLNRVSAIVLRQFYLIRGSASRVVPLFAWVAIDIVLWGFITKYLNTLVHGEVNLGSAILGAVLLWDFFMRVMQGVTMAFFEDVWSRNFLNYFASPLSVGEYLSGLVVSSMATSSIGLIVMLLLATQVFGVPFFSLGFTLLPFLFVLILFGISLGILACTMVLRLGPASEWFVWPIPALVVPFAGVYYPVSTLPNWMQGVSRALPPSYIFESLRAIFNGQSPSGSSLAIGGVLAIVYLCLSVVIFTRTYRYALRSGLVARYSAESVS